MNSRELVDHLQALDIHAPDSVEQRRFEEHVSRFLGREYQRLLQSDQPSPSQILESSSGPMWESTPDLMEEHYDEPRELFASFLDRRYMAYSMAYYGEKPDEIRHAEVDLTSAQQAKLALVVQRAEMLGTERVLSIGCGFGSLETYLAERFPGIEMTAITPSRVQSGYIQESREDPLHPLFRSNLKLITKSFAEIPRQDFLPNSYDVVFAIASFEAVANLRVAFQQINALLKLGGRFFLHLIVSKPVIMNFLSSDKTLIGKYFPGGKIWPYAIFKADFGSMVLEKDWFINGLNYWRTLDTWHRNFWNNLSGLYGSILDEEGIRHWNQYFSLCKVCFAPCDGTLYGNGHYRFRKTRFD